MTTTFVLRGPQVSICSTTDAIEHNWVPCDKFPKETQILECTQCEQLTFGCHKHLKPHCDEEIILELELKLQIYQAKI